MIPALDMLVVVSTVGFGALALPLGSLAMLLVLIAISLYQLVHLDDWTAAHNARVAARRAEESLRREG